MMNKRFRSAISGRWVTRLFARSHPSTTISERTGTTITIKLEPCGYCGKLVDYTEGMCKYCGTELDE